MMGDLLLKCPHHHTVAVQDNANEMHNYREI